MGSKTQVAALQREVCFAPVNGHRRAAAACPKRANNGSGQPYSITSSAQASTGGGTVRPRALAVLRLMTSSNLVGCTMRLKAQAAPVVIPGLGISGVKIPARIRLRADWIAVILALSARLPAMDDRHHRSSPE